MTGNQLVIVQDLATQWLQAYPCKTKTSQETEEILQTFIESKADPKVKKIDGQFAGISQSL